MQLFWACDAGWVFYVKYLMRNTKAHGVILNIYFWFGKKKKNKNSSSAVDAGKMDMVILKIILKLFLNQIKDYWIK